MRLQHPRGIWRKEKEKEYCLTCVTFLLSQHGTALRESSTHEVPCGGGEWNEHLTFPAFLVICLCYTSPSILRKQAGLDHLEVANNKEKDQKPSKTSLRISTACHGAGSKPAPSSRQQAIYPQTLALGLPTSSLQQPAHPHTMPTGLPRISG